MSRTTTVKKGRLKKRRRPQQTSLKTTELRIAWVTLATKVVVLVGAIVGVMSGTVGLVTLLMRLQEGSHVERALDRHRPADVAPVAPAGEQAANVEQALSGR